MRILLVFALYLAAAAFAAEGDFQLRNAPGKNLVEANCSMCHSLDYIGMNSPFLDRGGWEASVNKMIKVMGAPVSPGDSQKIIEYLSSQYGK